MTPKTPKKKLGPARDRRVWLERRAFDLSKHCPLDQTNPAACPLCDLRPRPARERRAWLHQLTDDELEYLATYHKTCYAVKTKERGRRAPGAAAGRVRGPRLSGAGRAGGGP